MLRAVVTGIALLLLVLSTGCISAISGQGSLVVSSSNSGVDVYLDGVQRGQTPVTLQNIPEGIHTLEFRYKNQPGWSSQVFVPRGGSSSVQLVFAGNTLESLFISPTPGATPVSVKPAGTTPTDAPSVAPGTTRTPPVNRTITGTLTIKPTRTAVSGDSGVTTRPTVRKTVSVAEMTSSSPRIELVDPVIAYQGIGDYITKIKVQVGLRKGADGINMGNPTVKEWTASFSTEPYWEITEKKYANGDDILTDGEIFVYTITTPKLYAGDVFSMSIVPENNEPGIEFTRVIPDTIQMDNVL